MRLIMSNLGERKQLPPAVRCEVMPEPVAMPNRRLFVRSALGLSAAAAALHAAGSRKPNIVFVLVDDMGLTDLHCYGSDFYESPNIDKLAREGMQFTQAYSACTVCSPSRAAILTGRYPARLHLTDFIPGQPFPFAKLRPPEWIQHLPREELTIAKALKPLGYATASIGKWHLGGAGFTPEDQGFDRNRGGTEKGQPPSYFSPYGISTLKDGQAGEYLTDRESSESLQFIEENRARPFFLYLPHHAVHTPLEAKQELIDKFKARVREGMPQKNAVYAAMIESVDHSVGALMAKLRKLKLEEQTIVVFTSDNGGLLASTKNLNLRAGKGSAYEGGVRVPLIVRWPGVVKPGTTCAAPVMGIDFYPTMLELASADRTPGQIIDGESLAPLLKGSGRLRRDTLFWHYPHYHAGGATPHSAIREQDWKLIEFQEDGRTELYHLASDPQESDDVSSVNPGRNRALQRKLSAWRQSVQAQPALPNPYYDPTKTRVRNANTND